MAHIYVLKCYLTRPQIEKIKQAAFAAGHRTLSSYARSILTGNTLFIEQKVMENNALLHELKEQVTAKS